jgi:site-specific recombinase XerD
MQNVNAEDVITQFIAHCRVKNLTLATLDHYERTLTYWQRWRVASNRPPELAAVVPSDFLEYLNYLQYERIQHDGNPYGKPGDTGLAANSVASAHRVLRTFWNWCNAAGLLSPEQCVFFARGRIPAPAVPEEPRPTYAPDVFSRMLDAAKQHDPEISYRDQAILWMFRDSGLRVSELCSLRDEDIDQEKRRARVRGKGRKHGFVFWSEDTAFALARYVQYRAGTRGGPLFRGAGVKNMGGALSPVAIRRMFRRLAQRAGVELPKGAPVHALRHTFAHEALDSGLDISHVSQLLRHTNIETTMRYLREDPDGLQAIYDRMKRDT